MKGNFEIGYKKWLENLDEKVPDQVWEGIQDELDLVEVWDRITDHYRLSSENKLTTIRQLIVFGLCSWLMLLVPFSLKNDNVNTAKFFQLEPQLEEGFIDKATVTVPNKNMDGIEPQFSAVILKEAPKFLPYGNHIGRVQNNKDLKEDEMLLVKQINWHSEAILLPAKKYNDPFEFVLEGTKPEIFGNGNELKSLTQVKYKNQRIRQKKEGAEGIKPKNIQVASIGLLAGIKNTWLLNHETFNGLKRATLSATLPTYRKESGVLATIILKEKHALVTELFWRSESGQKYRDYRNASYVHRDIRLSYFKTQVYYLLPNSYFPGELMTGGYIAYLNQGQEVLKETRMNVSGHYAAFDYGLVAGYQVNIPLSGRWSIIPSVRLNYNLTNIFSGNEHLPAEFKNTRNAAVSLNAALVRRLMR